MTDNLEQIIIQAATEVRKKYEQELLDEAEEKGIKKGLKEGREEGLKEVKKEIAIKLKTIHTPEEISKITGLDLNTIKNL